MLKWAIKAINIITVIIIIIIVIIIIIIILQSPGIAISTVIHLFAFFFIVIMSGRFASITFSHVASSRLQDSWENVSITVKKKKKKERREKPREDCRRFLLARFYAAWALFLLQIVWLTEGLAHAI